MANKHRGEVTIKLSGKDYVLRPTFGAMCELENRANMPVLNLIAQMEGGRIRLQDMAHIIWAGMYGYQGATCMSYEEVGDLLMETGLLNIVHQKNDDGVTPFTEFLANGVLGGEDVTEEVEAEQDPKPEKVEEAAVK